MERIINTSWRAQPHDTARLARWIRCMYQMSLTFGSDDSSSGSASLGRRCVEQATHICSQFGAAYPVEEAEWLATTAFNRAVDVYSGGDAEGARTWAERALELAATVEGKRLHRVMQERWMKMCFDPA